LINVNVNVSISGLFNDPGDEIVQAARRRHLTAETRIQYRVASSEIHGGNGAGFSPISSVHNWSCKDSPFRFFYVFCLSVCNNSKAAERFFFRDILHRGVLPKFADTFQFWLKSVTGTLHRDLHWVGDHRPGNSHMGNPAREFPGHSHTSMVDF
jgi:hypothetical protein